MKNMRDLMIVAVAGVTLIAAGCGQKPATTSDAPPDAAAPAAGEQPGAKKEGEHRARHEGSGEKKERAGGGSALTPEGAPPKVTSITLPEGTTLQVRTTTALSTKTMKTGDPFTASLMDDLVQDGVTVAPKGAVVHGRVAESDPGGRVKGVASISVSLTDLESDGKTIPISTNTVAKAAPSSKKKDALKVGIGSGLGAAIGAIAGGGKGAAIGAAAGAGAGGATVLATRGDPAVIPAESPLTFQLTAPAKVR